MSQEKLHSIIVHFFFLGGGGGGVKEVCYGICARREFYTGDCWLKIVRSNLSFYQNSQHILLFFAPE